MESGGCETEYKKAREKMIDVIKKIRPEELDNYVYEKYEFMN